VRLTGHRRCLSARWSPCGWPCRPAGEHLQLDIDITPELQVFARRVLAWREDALAPLGLSFAEASAGKVGFDGFLALRDEMMARGLLRWKNPEHHLSGYVFRAGFDEALDYIARYPLPDVT